MLFHNSGTRPKPGDDKKYLNQNAKQHYQVLKLNRLGNLSRWAKKKTQVGATADHKV